MHRCLHMVLCTGGARATKGTTPHKVFQFKKFSHPETSRSRPAGAGANQRGMTALNIEQRTKGEGKFVISCTFVGFRLHSCGAGAHGAVCLINELHKIYLESFRRMKIKCLRKMFICWLCFHNCGHTRVSSRIE